MTDRILGRAMWLLLPAWLVSELAATRLHLTWTVALARVALATWLAIAMYFLARILTRVALRRWRYGPARDRVFAVLVDADQPMSGLDVARASQVGAGRALLVLARYERDGLVKSEWERPQPYPDGRPRRRLYRLTEQGRVLCMKR